MSYNVESSSTSVPVIPSTDLPTVELDTPKKLSVFLKGRLSGIDDQIDILKAQRINGEAFLDLTPEDLKGIGILLGPAKMILKLINEIKGEQPVAEQPVAVKRLASPSVESRESKKGKFIDPELSNICDLVKNIRPSDNQDETPISADIIKHPQNKNLPVIGKPAIYVRESYDDLYRIIINKASKGSKHKFLVTGTSGIGKSCFLIYILIRLLREIKNITVIFQPLQSKVFYCFRDLDLSCGSYDDFSAYLHSSETWYLADGILTPKLVPAKTVVALSPKGTVKEDFQEFDKDVVVKFHMSPWSLDELKLCRQHVFPEVSEEIMQALYERAGGVPRYVFRRVDISLQYNLDPKINNDEIVKKSLERVESALLQVKSIDDLILCFTENAYFIQYSSRLIHRWPDDDSYETYHLRWASRYIYNEIERKLEKQSWNNLLEKIQMMKNYPSARGIMFEMYVIHLFRSSNDTFNMRQLLTTQGRPQQETFSTKKSTTIGNIRIARELSQYNSDDILIIPDVSNFGAADLLYTPDKIFQVTVSEDHPIKQVELVEIVENMPAYKRNGHIDLVFVVPDDIYDNFKYQNIVTKDAVSKNFRTVKTQNTKLKNMRQWALKVDISMSKSPTFARTRETSELDDESTRETDEGPDDDPNLKSLPRDDPLPKQEVDLFTTPESESSSKKKSKKSKRKK